MDMTDIDPRVGAGAAWLDEVQPDWWKVVDLDFLDQQQCDQCVLGQLVSWVTTGEPKRIHDGYQQVVNYSAPWCTDTEVVHSQEAFQLTDRMPIPLAKARGFHISSEDDWDMLTDDWRTTIAARREVTGFTWPEIGA